MTGQAAEWVRGRTSIFKYKCGSRYDRFVFLRYSSPLLMYSKSQLYLGLPKDARASSRKKSADSRSLTNNAPSRISELSWHYISERGREDSIYSRTEIISRNVRVYYAWMDKK